MISVGCCVTDFCIDCDFIDRIKRFLCSDHGCSYHPPENNSVDHSKKIANELAAMKEKARKQGTLISSGVLEQINAFMNQFIEHLKTINSEKYGGKQLNLKIDIIESELGKLRDEVTNFIGDRLDERLVVTDKELSIILEEQDEQKRTKNFNDFYVRVHKKAVMDLTQKIEEVIARQFVLVDDEICSRLKEVDADMKKAHEDYEEMERMMEEKDTALATKQVEYMYAINLYDIVIDELNSVAE